jgi:hypothetical protein
VNLSEALSLRETHRFGAELPNASRSHIEVRPPLGYNLTREIRALWLSTLPVAAVLKQSFIQKGWIYGYNIS